MDLISPLDSEFWLRVGASIACGGIIGLERQLRGKTAGIRTSILICLGTAMFVYLGSTFVAANADPTRVLGQVITGIGFLGAGVIISRDGLLKGVTSASVIWMLAAIGSIIGAGQYAAAIALAGIAVAVLIGVQLLEDSFRHLRQGVHQRDNEAPPAPSRVTRPRHGDGDDR